mgnify:CR=1
RIFSDFRADALLILFDNGSNSSNLGMLNNALATGSTATLKLWYEIDFSAVTESQRKARNTFKPITE